MNQATAGRLKAVVVAALLCWAPFGAQGDAVELVQEGMLMGAYGSTVGPGGDLFVAEAATGSIARVNPRTGEVTPYADGLPVSPLFAVIGLGGVTDVAFIGSTAYALVTLVGPPFVAGSAVDGIYRYDGNGWTPIADLGTFSLNNPPVPAFFVPTGVQFALEAFQGRFLVADGHHNRVLQVTLDGQVSEFLAFGNIVPTGLAVTGETVYMAEAGPVPHLPVDGRIVAFGPRSPVVTEVASGSPLLVDVEFGRGRTLFGLSQGEFVPGNPEGSPALPDTGALVRVERDGTFAVVEDGLNLPVSMEVIQNDAYVVTLTGGILRIDDIAAAPHGYATGR